MGILAWIILGGVAGWLASMVMKTNESQGKIMNVVVGVVGALIGGFVMNLFGDYGYGFNLLTLVVATVGAVVLLAVVGLFTGGSKKA